MKAKIDEIEWMCKKSGFNFICRSREMLSYAVRIGKKTIEVGSNNWKDTGLPMLIQRSVEAVNRNNSKNGKFYIETTYNAVNVKLFMNEAMWIKFLLHDYSEDDAKLSALRYIKEQS